VPFDHIKGPLQRSAADDDQMESGIPAVSSHAVQWAAAAAAPNEATSAKAKKVLHNL
jgi:hypothetical protein